VLNKPLGAVGRPGLWLGPAPVAFSLDYTGLGGGGLRAVSGRASRAVLGDGSARHGERMIGEREGLVAGVVDWIVQAPRSDCLVLGVFLTVEVLLPWGLVNENGDVE